LREGQEQEQGREKEGKNHSSATMMHMTFYWGKSVIVLFDQWAVKTWQGYILTLIVLFVFSVVHEWLAVQRSLFLTRSTAGKTSAVPSAAVSDDTPEAPLLGEVVVQGSRMGINKALESLLFGIKVGLGYLLMLAVMSYNGGVFLSIVAGLAVGYFFFRSGSAAPSFHDPCCSS
jgi:copper transporter 1